MKIKIILCVSALILASFSSACSGSSSDKQGNSGSVSSKSEIKNEYAMTIDDEEISLAEFSVYLFEMKNRFEEDGGSDIWDTDFDGTPAPEAAKEFAYNSILCAKASCKNAADIGVSLTEEDKSEAVSQAEDILGRMNPEYCERVGLTLEKATEVMEESVLTTKVMEAVTSSYQPSDADYSAYIDSYIEENPDDPNPRAALESILREDYIKSKKDEIYNDQIKKWREKIKAEKNTAVWDSIDITEL